MFRPKNRFECKKKFQKNIFAPKIILGPKIFLIPKLFWGQKYFVSKINSLYETIEDPENFSEKIMLVKKIYICQKRIEVWLNCNMDKYDNKLNLMIL